MNPAKKPTTKASPVKKTVASNPVKKTPTTSPVKPKISSKPKEETKKSEEEIPKKEETQPENPELKAILDSIDFKEIDYIRSLPSPPVIIINVSKVIFQLINGGPFDWTLFRQNCLKGKKTMHRVLNINLSGVDAKTVEEAKKIIAENNVTEESIAQVSRVTVSLFRWAKKAIELIESKPDLGPEVAEQRTESAV